MPLTNPNPGQFRIDINLSSRPATAGTAIGERPQGSPPAESALFQPPTTFTVTTPVGAPRTILDDLSSIAKEIGTQPSDLIEQILRNFVNSYRAGEWLSWKAPDGKVYLVYVPLPPAQIQPGE
jgi:hypothetical protein